METVKVASVRFSWSIANGGTLSFHGQKNDVSLYGDGGGNNEPDMFSSIPPQA